MRITDVSLTDGQSATWGGAMTGSMSTWMAPHMARTAVDSIEITSVPVMQQDVARGHDPWERIRSFAEAAPNTRLRASLSLIPGHGEHGCDVIGPDVAEAWLEQAKSAGILEVLITDPLPGTDRSAPVVAAAKAMGLHAILVLPLPEVQVEDAALIALASGFANAAPDRVQLRDEAGVLTDERLARLIAPLRAGLGCIPLDLHTRCQTSYGPLVALEAARLGLDGLDLALAPVANGGSVPALGRFLKSLATLGIGDHVAADFTSVTDALNRLAELADFHDWEIGRPWAFGLAPYRHNLPGDVAAQAMAALTKAGLSRRINDLAEECAAIRRDIGGPPMLAPFAGAVAAQALRHLHEARYATIARGIRLALQQVAGEMPGPVDSGLLARVGAVRRPVPSTMTELRKTHPNAADADLVASQITGCLPAALPKGRFEPYAQDSPEDALAAGLAARAAGFADLRVTAPGVDLAFRTGGE